MLLVIFPGTLEPAKSLGEIPKSQEDAINQARGNSPEVLSARFDERASAEAIKVQTGALLPTLGLEAEASRQNDTTSDDSRTDRESINLAVTVPLYQAGAVSSRIREAKQTHGQRRRELDAAIRSAIADSTTAWEEYQTSIAQIKALTAGVRAASIALEGVRQESQVGSRTVLDVLDAEQELLNARVSLVGAQRDEVVASMDVRRRIGTLQAANLDLGVPTYDFKAYYNRIRNKWFGWSIESN